MQAPPRFRLCLDGGSFLLAEGELDVAGCDRAPFGVVSFWSF